MSIVPLVVSVAEAGTGAGVEAAMSSIVSLIIALAVIACVGAAAWLGIRFLGSHDYSNLWGGLTSLGIGGGLIAGARTFGAQLTGSAAASTLFTVPPDLVSVVLDDLTEVALTTLVVGVFFLVTLHTRRRVSHV